MFLATLFWVMLSCHTIMKPYPIPIPNPNLLTNHIPSYSMTAWHENGTLFWLTRDRSRSSSYYTAQWFEPVSFVYAYARERKRGLHVSAELSRDWIQTKGFACLYFEGVFLFCSCLYTHNFGLFQERNVWVVKRTLK
jgi:hypothetical protein